ncbi:tetratricopeptide repeat-containing sulfotransferase family protein [Sphingorhabdus arenilitoris]|uniref:Tetratricopeptide repeat-containing sulfotransferase family protein n=1 Tax=Sphingorhabdus arenilitoris TaxID=1490041 RepID=A0ABV8RI23_9SPHN
MQKNWLSEAKKQLGANNLAAAYDLALGQLSADKSDGDAWGIMALVALEGGNAEKAAELSEKAMAFGCRAMWLRTGYARSLLSLGRHDEARDLAAATNVNDCASPLEADTIGVVLARTGLHEKAVPFFERAVAGDGTYAQYRYNLATSLQFTGQLRAAASQYKSVLNIDPSHHRSRLALVQLEPHDDGALAQIETLFSDYASDMDAALLLGHAAARIWEDRGDHIRSLDWLLKAKKLKSQNIHHDRHWVEGIFAAAKHGSPEQSTAPSQHQSSSAPLFIVGMPRSGTTLIERILSSHDDVCSAGELPDLGLLIKQSGASGGRHILSADTLSAPYDPREVGRQYLRRTKQLAGRSVYMIDKMPFNFFFVRHIIESLPNARIIMVRRDPRDTVFANFRQLFATDFGYYNYAYDLDDCVHFVSHFNALADHWQSVLPPERYQQICYEDMIADQEGESRRLIAFLGLDWQQQCLQFHKNKSPVATASSVQVRSPIHSGSVARWKRYGDYSDQVNAAFAQNGLMMD